MAAGTGGRGLHRAVLTLVALLLIVSCGGTPEQSSGDPGPSRIQGTPFDGAAAAGAAIDGFTARKDPNASFARIHDLVRDDPALIREAALRRLDSQDPNVR